MFFFFKQKTAYEMRISDWSSDVCSSDLLSLSNNAYWATGVGAKWVQVGGSHKDSGYLEGLDDAAIIADPQFTNGEFALGSRSAVEGLGASYSSPSGDSSADIGDSSAADTGDSSADIGDSSAAAGDSSTDTGGSSTDAGGDSGSEERRVGNGGVSTCRFRWQPDK